MAQAHGEEEHGEETPDVPVARPETRGPLDLRNSPWLSNLQYSWFMGTSNCVSPRGIPVGEFDVSGEWSVFEVRTGQDTSAIYLLNIPAENGFFLTGLNDTNQDPQISGNVVVWKWGSNGRSAVVAYFVDTNETRVISAGGWQHRNPVVKGNLIAWQDDRQGDWAVRVHDLSSGETRRIAGERIRSTDPEFVGNAILWREYEFNQYDVAAYNFVTNETRYLTRDRDAEGRVTTDGNYGYFIQNRLDSTVWLYRYDGNRGALDVLGGQLLHPKVAGANKDVILTLAATDEGSTLHAYNATSGMSSQLSGPLRFGPDVILRDRTIYATVGNETGFPELCKMQMSVYALRAQPRLNLIHPTSGTVIYNYTAIRGWVTPAQGWGAPTGIAYAFTGRQWIVFNQPGVDYQNFTGTGFFLDVRDMALGRQYLKVRVFFEDAPPIEQSFMVTVRQFNPKFIDIAQLSLTAQTSFWDAIAGNPGIVVFFILILCLIALILIRYVLRSRPRGYAVVEYVRPGS